MKSQMAMELASHILHGIPGLSNRLNLLTPNDMSISRVRWLFVTDVATFAVLMLALSVLLVWSVFDPD